MTKIKKIVVAAIAAVGLSAAGATAFAYTDYIGPNDSFHFDMGDSSRDESGTAYSAAQVKEVSVGYAEVVVDQGNPAPNINFPLYTFVCDRPSMAWEARATETIEFTGLGNLNSKKLTYFSGKGKINEAYYLCGFCGEYNLNVSGVWRP